MPRWIGQWLAGALVAGIPCMLPAQPPDIAVFELPTRDGDLYYVIDVDETSATLRGLAVDDGGKVYVSDQGDPNGQNGAIYMLLGTNRAVIIHEGLSAPGDIELTPDQRGLVIAREGGGVDVRYFGVAIKFLNDTSRVLNALAILETDWGPIRGIRRSDGYFHFPDVLRPGQESLTATLIVNNAGLPQAHEIALADPETGEITGQAFVEVLLEE